jgi:hypothetical protein
LFLKVLIDVGLDDIGVEFFKVESRSMSKSRLCIPDGVSLQEINVDVHWIVGGPRDVR